MCRKYSFLDGEERIVCQVSNELQEEVTVGYLDLVPWHFRLLVHTLEVTNSENSRIEPSFLHYVPSQGYIYATKIKLLAIFKYLNLNNTKLFS